MGQAVIATTTFYMSMDDVRAKLALETARAAKTFGYPLVVVDGGSPEDFKNELQRWDALALDETSRGMGAGRRQALAEAAKLAGQNGVVIWMEPEKWMLVRCLNKAAGPILDNEADLVIPARESLESYPPEQAYAELMGNLAIKYLLGQWYDFWFGPFVANRRALHFFLEYRGKYGDKWDSIHIPRLHVIKAGLRLASVEVNYIHPSEQTAEETGNMDFFAKRLDQLQNMVPAFRKEAELLGLYKP